MYEALDLTRIIPEGNSTQKNAQKYCFVTSWGWAFTGPVIHTSSDKRPWIYIMEARTPWVPGQSSCQENTSFSFQSNYCDGPEGGKIARGFSFGSKPSKNRTFHLVEILSNLKTWKKKQWAPRKHVGFFCVYKLSWRGTFTQQALWKYDWFDISNTSNLQPDLNSAASTCGRRRHLFPMLVECSLE